MSALGQKQTSEGVKAMAALPPEADMDQHGRDVRLRYEGFTSAVGCRLLAQGVVKLL